MTMMCETVACTSPARVFVQISILMREKQKKNVSTRTHRRDNSCSYSPFCIPRGTQKI